MIECHQILKKDYQYAVRNGYVGTHDDYCKNVYSKYASTCRRNQITPMTWYKWLQSRNKG